MFTDVYNDVTGQQSDDEYAEEAIYDILKIDYTKSKQINEKVDAINDYVVLARIKPLGKVSAIKKHLQ